MVIGTRWATRKMGSRHAGVAPAMIALATIAPAKIALATIVLALGASACGDDFGDFSSEATDDAGTATNGGFEDANEDAGLRAGNSSDAPGVVTQGEGTDSARACYDNLDNNGDGALDCQDSSCKALGSCCVGDGDCCTLASQIAITFSGCEGMSLTDCLANQTISASEFGDPLPFVRDGLLSLGGDATGQTGAIISDGLNLKEQRIAVQATFVPAENCGTGCLESAGVSLSTQDTTELETRIRAVAQLLLSGSRQEMTFSVAGSVVMRWPVTETENWQLVARPSGEVSAFRDGNEVIRVPFEATGVARVVLHGHSRTPTPGTPPGARLRQVTVQTSLCDIPGGWAEREELALLTNQNMPAAIEDAESPSLAYDGTGRAAVAFERANGIWLARSRDGSPIEFQTTTDVDAPALSGSAPWNERKISDPELVWDEENNQWVVFYVGESNAGERSIGRAVAAASAATFVDDDAPALAPADYQVSSFGSPGVTIHPSGFWVMVASVMTNEGNIELRAFQSTDRGVTWGEVTRIDLESALALESINLAEIDEVDDPSLMVRGGAYQLYYSLRRGTRWSIGALASDELVFWRPLNSGDPVLEASSSGFDRLGVRSPSVVGRDSTVELVYEGLDGVRGLLGRTARQSAPAGRFL